MSEHEAKTKMRPTQSSPRGPKSCTSERQVKTRAWLARVQPSQEPTQSRVEELCEFVDRYLHGSPYQLIADAMVRNDEIPRHADVRRRYQRRKEAWERRKARSGEPIALTPEVRNQIVEIVQTTWDDSRRGPYWSEIREATGWDSWQTQDILQRLKATGVVDFNRLSGSMNLPSQQPVDLDPPSLNPKT